MTVQILILLLLLLANLATVGLNLKLYTEIMKEKTQRNR